MKTWRSRTVEEERFSAVTTARERFSDWKGDWGCTDARYADASGHSVVAWAGMSSRRPIVNALLNHKTEGAFFRKLVQAGQDVLIASGDGRISVFCHAGGVLDNVTLGRQQDRHLKHLLAESETWPGYVTEEGDHCFDPRTPSPGTHFRANLLIGNRAGLPHALLTTPKAIVDAWGGGSSRSHSNKEMLATRWDRLPEENGFPANRQFYLVEEGEQIFYSAQPASTTEVQTRHAPNHTVITYVRTDGLVIKRTIFVVPAGAGVDYGLEVQLVDIENRGDKPRRLQMVPTGMLGYPHPGALTVDVIYTCVTVRPRVLMCDEGEVLAVAPAYTAGWSVDDQPFSMVRGYDDQGRSITPEAFSLDYAAFIGNGTLSQPENVVQLNNALPQKGPAFYALACPLDVRPGGRASCHIYNGLLSKHDEGADITDEYLEKHLTVLSDLTRSPAWALTCLSRVRGEQEDYSRALEIACPDQTVNNLVNCHLPMQVRYQTYVSRSFGLTQKGFRQIGFREIQDLFAALPFELAAGRQQHIRELIEVWAEHVHAFGYCNHQFYWQGIEPGKYSDDGLWLFQAVGRYVDLTGDISILDDELPVAGNDEGTRTVYETLNAILHYSGEVSIGKNGLPLIDHADWNDTLNLDGEKALSGPAKEALYRQQLAEGLIRDGEPLQTDLSESVMNGFLLEVARSYMVRFARLRNDQAMAEYWSGFGEKLAARLQQAWKGDFFARAFLNRRDIEHRGFLGASGDGFSNDPALNGTYFLNSFSWSILSDIASERQIRTMFERVKEILLTPYGLRLSSPTDFRAIMPHTGSGDYAYGDRENGGVFKHATMMAVQALIKAAREVEDETFGRELADMAWEVLQAVAPYRTMSDPYVLAGNPRICTQYTNPASGEHVGPLLSGTAPWMWLNYVSLLGISHENGRVSIDPVLPAGWSHLEWTMRVAAGTYHVVLHKEPGVFRVSGDGVSITVNGQEHAGPLPAAADRKTVEVRIALKERAGCAV